MRNSRRLIKITCAWGKVLRFIPGDEPLRGPFHEGYQPLKRIVMLIRDWPIYELHVKCAYRYDFSGDTFINEPPQKS